jgi:hypothetical protein
MGARAYLLTDDDVTDAVARHASDRPHLDAISRHALTAASSAPSVNPQPDEPGTGDDADQSEDAENNPENTLWIALSLAPDEGISVPELVAITRMSRRWVYYRLRELSSAGRASQTARGQWRTAPEGCNRE